jgi:hypothetical protein
MVVVLEGVNNLHETLRPGLEVLIEAAFQHFCGTGAEYDVSWASLVAQTNLTSILQRHDLVSPKLLRGIREFEKNTSYKPRLNFDFVRTWSPYWGALQHHSRPNILPSGGGAFLQMLLYLSWWAQAPGKSGMAAQSAIKDVVQWLTKPSEASS